MRVRLDHVTKRHEATRAALDEVSLDVADGELLVVLGPSGSGKTTLLHAIAGLTPLESGRVLLGDRDVSDEPAQTRKTPLVLQRHGLFPHLRVLDNVAFGLRMEGVPRPEREARARAALRDVRLEGLERRYPSELSGGEAQRVAIARALVTRPRVLLMDEPFSSLDATLRTQMQDLLLDLHATHPLTILFVTHDQREALRLGQRIAVLRDGRIRQVGPAREVYDRPTDATTARFLGLTNILPATLHAGRVSIADVGAFPLPEGVKGEEGDRVLAAFRPEHLALRSADAPEGVRAHVAAVDDHGSTVDHTLHVGAARLTATTLGPPRHRKGDEVRVLFERPPWVIREAQRSHRSTKDLNEVHATEGP